MEAPGGFVPREKVMSVLWPDSDNDRARQSLRTSLYQIRQSAGADVLTNRGAVDLGVNASLLFVDSVALRAAVAQGRYQDAVDLYGGPLLSGFHLDDTLEFEEWAQRARKAVEADALRALREVARAREGAGEIEAARGLLLRAQEIAPADEDILRNRLLLLDRQGNRAAAVAEGEEWIEMLRASLDIDPSEPTLRLMRELRSGGVLAEAVPVMPSAPSDAPASPEAPPPVARPAVLPAHGHRPLARQAPLAGLLATAAVAFLAWMGFNKPPTGQPVEGGVIVAPFGADSSSGGRTVGVALGALTARYLQPETGGLVFPVEGVDVASFDGRNRRLISGRIRTVDGRLVADVTLATTDDPGTALARVTAAVEDPDLEAFAIKLADELRRQSELDFAERGPIPRLTRAEGAIAPFFEGEILSRAGRTQEAGDSYRLALDLDSTFAMAHFRFAVTQDLLGREPEGLLALDRVLNLWANLTDGERKLVDAWQAYKGGGVVNALPRYEELAASRGPDPDVWIRLAELRFHWGPQMGIPRDSAAVALRVLLRLVPDDADALLHLIRLMGPTADPNDLNQAIRHLQQLPASEDALEEAVAIVALNQRRSPDASVAKWLAGNSVSLESRRLTQLAASARVPYDLAPFVRTMEPASNPSSRILRRLFLAQLAASAGRIREANAELDALSTMNPYRAIEYRGLLAVTSPVALPADTLRALRQRLRSIPLHSSSLVGLWSVTREWIDSSRALVLDAMLTSRLGEPIDPVGILTRGRSAYHMFEPTFARYVRAVVLEGEGNHARVVTTLGTGSPESGTLPDPLSYLIGTSKWARIQSLVALGRDEEALRWIQTIPDVGGYDLIYIAPASLLQAQILERLGRSAQAAAAFQRAAEVWADADPEFDSLIDSARRGAERTTRTPAS